MATITSYTKELLDQIRDGTVIDGEVNGSGHLILEKWDGTFIDAGSVIGPQGPVGDAEPGDIVTSIRTSKLGYLLLDGSAVVNANTLYPDLWAVAPAGWKNANGTTLDLPNLSGRVLQGGAAGTMGDLTGSNTKILVAANLPPHTHTGPSHTHTAGAHTHGMAHTHTITHTHEHSHTHSDSFAIATTITTAVRQSSTAGTFASLMAASSSGVNEVQTDNPLATSQITGSVGAASDATTSNPSVGSSGGASVGTTGSGGNVATSADGTGATGPGPGTSTALDVQQQAMRVNFFVKT